MVSSLAVPIIEQTDATTKEEFGKISDSAPWCVANFFEIVKGVGMFPNKVLQKVSKAEILQNAILLFYEYCPLCLHFLYQ